MRNSIDAVRARGRIEIAARLDGTAVILSVCDDGPGFAEPEAAFRPFYSTKPSASGLGLSLVRDIAAQHSGRATLENREGGGARARLVLPLSN